MEILIALSSGLAVGMATIALLYWINAKTSHRRYRPARDGEEALEWLLAAIPMPDWIRVRWDRGELELELTRAGVGISSRAFVGFRWILLWSAGLLSALMVLVRGLNLLTGFAALTLAVGAWVTPTLWLRWQIEARLQQINHSLPDLMDRIGLGLEAGLGFEMALQRTLRRQNDLLGNELKLVLAMLSRGHTKSEALDRMVRRNPSPELRAFAAAIKRSERLGGSLTKTLKVQGELLRTHRHRRAQEASRRLPILIVFPLVFFFLPALLIVYLGPPLLHLLLGQ